MIRCLCHFIACFMAKAIEEIVLPPPVGTVSEYSPCFPSPFRMHVWRISQRFSFKVFLGRKYPSSSSLLQNIADISFKEENSFFLTGWLFIKASVSRKSASTRHENSIRVRIITSSVFLFSINVFRWSTSRHVLSIRYRCGCLIEGIHFFIRPLNVDVPAQSTLLPKSGIPAWCPATHKAPISCSQPIWPFSKKDFAPAVEWSTRLCFRPWI